VLQCPLSVRAGIDGDLQARLRACHIYAVSSDRPKDSGSNALRAIIAGFKRSVGSPQTDS
jgi:hypothetical protein